MSVVGAGTPVSEVRPTTPPTKHMGIRRLLAVNAMWLGQGAHWPPITFQLVPVAAFMIAGDRKSVV